MKANEEIRPGNFKIANAELQLSVAFSKGLETSIIAQQNITPLFKVMRIKNRFFTSPIFTTRGVKSIDLLTPEFAKGEMKDQVYFGDVEFELEEE